MHPAMWPDEAGLNAAAQALATQALPVFFAALPLVLIFAACAWWMARRYAVSQWRSRSSLQVQLVITLSICLVIVNVAVGTFAAIAGEIGPGEELSRLDHAFSGAIGQTVSPGTRAVFAAVTHLGDRLILTALGIAVAIALVVRGERLLAQGWVVAIGGNAAVNQILKSVFERARPLHDHGSAIAIGWSFPSGHASGSVILYGMLAYVVIRTLPAAWHLPTVLLASGMAFTIGCSRVFIQVHFASDVVAGFASGTAWLALCIGGIELIRYRRRTRP
jgi:undecaprenyl-diphosphatase